MRAFPGDCTMRIEPIEFGDLEDEATRGTFEDVHPNREADAVVLSNLYTVEATFPATMVRTLKALRNAPEDGDLPYELTRKVSIAVAMADDARTVPVSFARH